MVTQKQILDLARSLTAKINDEVAPAVGAILPAVKVVGDAVNALEQKVTDAVNNGSIPPEVQADMESTFAELTGAMGKLSDVATVASNATTGAKAVSDDATDGINEAAQQPVEEMLTKMPSALDPSKNPHP